MLWALATFLAVAVASGTAPAGTATPQLVRARVAALEVRDRADFDPQAEDDLLDLANRDRARAEAQPLQLNDCLMRAARRHAEAMAAQQQLSHQFPGEADLAERLTQDCAVHFDEAAENVALADSADRANDGLMTSRAHRANLLYPSYNAVGIGVVRRGSTLYIVQDFAHVLPAYSSTQAEGAVAKSVEQTRGQAGLQPLRQRSDDTLHAEACGLAQRGSLQPAGPARAAGARYILRYTSAQPGDLPSVAAKALSDRSLNGFAAGACFVRNASYPGGGYWVVLRLY